MAASPSHPRRLVVPQSDPWSFNVPARRPRDWLDEWWLDGRHTAIERTAPASPSPDVQHAAGGSDGTLPATGAGQEASQADREPARPEEDRGKEEIRYPEKGRGAEAGEEGGAPQAGQEGREADTRQEGCDPSAGQEEGRTAPVAAGVHVPRFQLVVGRSVPPVLLLLLLAVFTTGCRSRGPEGLALVGATVIDGSGRAPLKNAVVIVRGTHIDTIVPAAGYKVPRRMRVVDVTGKWIIPGLIDAHAHVSRWALRRYLAFGVTSVRDLHGAMDSILPLRAEVNLNSIAGPRIYAAGAMIDGVPPTYPDAFAVHDQRQARRAVDSLVQAGADLVKLYTKIDPELMRAVTDEARTFQMRVAAHLGLTDAVTAANLGVRSIEHLSGVPEAASRSPEALYAAHRAGFFQGWTAFEKSWATLDSASLQRVADALVAKRVILVPTLVLHETYANLDAATTYTDSALKAVPRAEIERWNTADMIQRAGWTRADFEAFRKSRPVQDLFLRLFYMGHGIIVTGTDASNQQLVPGASEHRELQLLVRAGIPPENALLAATRNAALLIGADSIGTLAPGRVADLLVLTKNPYESIANTRSIQYVMARGNLMPADSLRRGF